jgi:hypothetical protein
VNPDPITVTLVSPLPTATDAGEIELITGAGFTMVKEDVADPVDAATLVAVTETVFGEGSTMGAV